MMGDEFEVLELQEENGKRHSVLHIPRSLPEELTTEDTVNTDSIFNIFMGDVSGSMCTYWPRVVEGWQEYVRDKLQGRTKIFVFESYVHEIREGPDLKNEDNKGGGTNITSALLQVRTEVDQCLESNVRIFIVTDGAHGASGPPPESQINLMCPPVGKTVSVYLLGVGNYFPVNYSVDIRSHMHNGNANIPTLFWAKESGDIVAELLSISNELDAGLVKLTLSTEGLLLPGLNKVSSVHLGEYIYYDEPPEQLPKLSVSVNDGEFKELETTTKPSTLKHLLEGLFRQWNSVLIQQHRKKAHVPKEVFELMDSLFNYHYNIITQNVPAGQDIKSRIARKQSKTCQVEYQTLKNQSKSIIDVEGKFQNELELAETILKSTVINRKYDMKNLKLKGHGQDEYDVDIKEFKRLYNVAKPKIMELPPLPPEECCHVTISSTLSDLQDPNFELILEENKFDLLKLFSITGIPIYAPVRDASQINPWTLVIKRILVTPFTILSQQVLEHSADADQSSLGMEDKDVILQKDNEGTRFNAIIPLIPPYAAKVLKPLVLSNIYSMMSTFCILKNPHIIDYNAHIAALACAWMRTVKEFPVANRPEFASDRLKSIVATASLYLGRPSIKRYIDVLLTNPSQALMTESTEEFEEKTLKCESLIKPTFYMYLKKDEFSMDQITATLDLILYEFIGRCLSSYKIDESEATPFTDYYCAQLSDKEERKKWLGGHCKTIIDSYQNSQGDLLEKFYTLDDLIPGLKQHVDTEVMKLTATIQSEIVIATDMKKVKGLRNYGSCGDIKWSSLKAWAQEMGISQEKIDEAFQGSKVMAYIKEAFVVKSSRDRMSKGLPDPDGVKEYIEKKVLQENTRSLRNTILKEVEEFAINDWRTKYKKVHTALVMPMTQEEIIVAAQSKGINVTASTFKVVYRRYSEHLGLLRNACQIPACPHYLQPHNNFNQHLSIDREDEDFPHSLHKVSRAFCNEGIDDVISKVTSGEHAGTKNRKTPPPPKPDALQPLIKEIESLLSLYSKKYDSTQRTAV